MINKLILGLLFASFGVPSTVGDPNLLKVTAGNSLFANNFYRAISKIEERNILFSPLSAHIALSMLYQGAAGETHAKFADALYISNQKVAASGYENTLVVLNNLENVTLCIAEKIYATQNVRLKSKFKDVIEKSFASEVERVNFRKSQITAEYINGWVDTKTNHKITKVIDPQSLSGSTLLVLVSAVYFKSSWKSAFSKNDTSTELFYVSDRETVDCQMMHLTDTFKTGYNDLLKAQVLQLNYLNEDVSLVIILPRRKDGIQRLEDELLKFDLSTVAEGLYETETQVSLPTFKIETTMALQPILEEMGLGIIFESTADFSGISEGGPNRFFVTNAVQKAFIEVNEGGTEAAAATAFSGLLSLPLSFTADHPFVILLQAKYKGVTNTLFYGRIMNPNY